MNIIRIKNGYRITVKKWSKEVIVSDTTTGKVVKVQTFPDHIKAVIVAKSL